MLSTLLSFSFVGSALALGGATKGAVVGNGFIRFPIAGHDASSITGYTKRQTSAPLENNRRGTFYTIDLTIGTPDQPVEVQLDTGSSELWVNPVCANSYNPDYCNSLPRFTPGSSSSFVDLKTPFYIRYGLGDVSGTYGKDFVSVAGAKITGQQFGVATSSQYNPFGILGVGPALVKSGETYPFFIDSLAQQGHTQSRAFSLDLRSVDSPDGSIIFGGLDTKKYKGALKKVPMIEPDASPDGFNRYWIKLNEITYVAPDGKETKMGLPPAGLPVFLDSGATLSFLPEAIFTALGSSFPNYKILTEGNASYYAVDCALKKEENAGVDFSFGDKKIRVLFKDFIWEYAANSCVVGIQPESEAGFAILGDSFLRAAYVVYDQDNRNLHLAQAANCGTELLAITKGANAVPSVTGGCGSTATSTSTSPTTTTSDVSSATTSTSSATSGGVTTSSTSSTDDSSTAEPTTIYDTTSGHTTATSTSTHTYPNTTWTSASSEPTTYTSTYKITQTYTITSCAPTVTQCPYGHVTTKVIEATTTWCPGAETKTKADDVRPMPSTTYTSTFKVTKTYTITSCAPTVTVCPIGKVTTQVVESTTTWCPGQGQTQTVKTHDHYSTTVATVPVPPYTTLKPVCPGCGVVPTANSHSSGGNGSGHGTSYRPTGDVPTGATSSAKPAATTSSKIVVTAGSSKVSGSAGALLALFVAGIVTFF